MHAELQVHVTGICMEKPTLRSSSCSMTSPRMMTEVVPSPTSSSCVRLSSMIDYARYIACSVHFHLRSYLEGVQPLCLAKHAIDPATQGQVHLCCWM